MVIMFVRGLLRAFLQLRASHAIFCLILTALSLPFQTGEGESEAQRRNGWPETTCTGPHNCRGRGFAIRQDLKELWSSPGREAMAVAPLPPYPSLLPWHPLRGQPTWIGSDIHTPQTEGPHVAPKPGVSALAAEAPQPNPPSFWGR